MTGDLTAGLEGLGGLGVLGGLGGLGGLDVLAAGGNVRVAWTTTASRASDATMVNNGSLIVVLYERCR
jgi:hypothetical protein